MQGTQLHCQNNSFVSYRGYMFRLPQSVGSRVCIYLHRQRSCRFFVPVPRRIATFFATIPVGRQTPGPTSRHLTVSVATAARQLALSSTHSYHDSVQGTRSYYPSNLEDGGAVSSERRNMSNYHLHSVISQRTWPESSAAALDQPHCNCRTVCTLCSILQHRDCNSNTF